MDGGGGGDIFSWVNKLLRNQRFNETNLRFMQHHINHQFKISKSTAIKF